MKTFKQFQEETQQLDEALPALIPAALKLGGMALSAFSAGSALNNLRKGKYKQAAFDALGAVPGGRAFKIAKGLGASKNLARGASALQSASRWNMTGLTPNAYAKGADKVIDTAIKGVTGIGKGNKSNKPNQPGSGVNSSAKTNLTAPTNTSNKTDKKDKPKVMKYISPNTTLTFGGNDKGSKKKSTN